MRHDICLEGYAFRLRPISDGDAYFIVELRNNPALNQYIHAISNCVEDQIAWLAKYYERAGDYYFLLENKRNQSAEGVISIYGIDLGASTGEWGRWILKPHSLAAVESAWLIYRIAFEVLGLESIYCRTVADNAKVVSFHDSCGILHRHVLREHFNIGGNQFDAIEHRVSRQDWLEIEQRLAKLARLIARKFACV